MKIHIKFSVPSTDTRVPPLVLTGVLLIMFTFWNYVNLTTNKRCLPKLLISPMSLVHPKVGGAREKELTKPGENIGGSENTVLRKINRNYPFKRKPSDIEDIFIPCL